MQSSESKNTVSSHNEELPPFTPLREASATGPTDETPKKWYRDGKKLSVVILIIIILRIVLRIAARQDVAYKETKPRWTSSEVAFVNSLDPEHMTAEELVLLQEMSRRKNEAGTGGSGPTGSTQQGTGTSSASNRSGSTDAGSSSGSDTSQTQQDTPFAFNDSVVNVWDYTNGRSTGFMDDPDLTNKDGFITVHAFMELEGWQLITLLQRSGYQFESSATSCKWSLEGGRSTVLLSTKEGSIDPVELAELPKGCANKPMRFGISIGRNYGNPIEAYEAIAHCKTVARGTSERNDLVVLCESSTGEQFLALVDNDEEVGYIVEVVNDAALRASMLNWYEYPNAKTAFEAITGMSV